MPTNDDTPIIETLAAADVATDDLLQIYDRSAGKMKAISFADLLTALDTGGLAAD